MNSPSSEKISDENKEEQTPSKEVAPDLDEENSAEKEEEEEKDWRDVALRSMAELENLRKRTERERVEFFSKSIESIFSDILPILDNFDMGMSELRKLKGSKEVSQGLEMIYKQFNSLLELYKISLILPREGDNFDALIHEAVSQEVSDLEQGKIIRLVRRGFSLREKLLRPATVIVSKGAAEKEERDV